MWRQDHDENTLLICVVYELHVHMARMAIHNQQPSSIASFSFRVTLKYPIEPLQTKAIAAPAIFRGCKIDLIILIKVFNLRVLKISRFALVDKSGWEERSISANTGEKADEFTASILTGTYNSALFKGTTTHNTLRSTCLPNHKSFFIPIVKVFSGNIVLFDAIDELHRS